MIAKPETTTGTSGNFRIADHPTTIALRPLVDKESTTFMMASVIDGDDQ